MKISCDSIQCGLQQRLLSQNQVNRRVGFTEEKATVTPLTRQFHALSLTDREGSGEMTVNTRGVLNEMSALFGRWVLEGCNMVAMTGAVVRRSRRCSISCRR